MDGSWGVVLISENIAKSKKEKATWCGNIRNNSGSIDSPSANLMNLIPESGSFDMSKEEIIKFAKTMGGGSLLRTHSNTQLKNEGIPKDIEEKLKGITKKVSSESTQQNELEIIHEGFLEKKSELKKEWKKRWVIICKGGPIFYYNQKEDENPIGVIYLENAEVYKVTGMNGINFPLWFTLRSKRKDFLFRAENKEEKDKWVRVIQENITRSPSFAAMEDNLLPSGSFFVTKEKMREIRDQLNVYRSMSVEEKKEPPESPKKPTKESKSESKSKSKDKKKSKEKKKVADIPLKQSHKKEKYIFEMDDLEKDKGEGEESARPKSPSKKSPRSGRNRKK